MNKVKLLCLLAITLAFSSTSVFALKCKITSIPKHKANEELRYNIGASRTCMVLSAIKAGANVNSRSKIGVPALLMAASQEQNLKIIEILIENGGDINIQATSGAAALHIAAWNRETGIAKYLLAKGANPNIRTKKGVVPLMHAVRKCHIPTVQALVDGKADVNAQDNKGARVYDYFKTQCDYRTVQIPMSKILLAAGYTGELPVKTAAETARIKSQEKAHRDCKVINQARDLLLKEDIDLLRGINQAQSFLRKKSKGGNAAEKKEALKGKRVVAKAYKAAVRFNNKVAKKHARKVDKHLNWFALRYKCQ